MGGEGGLKVAQVKRMVPPARTRVSEAGGAGLWRRVRQSRHDGVKRFTATQLDFQLKMMQNEEPAHLVREMPDDPSGHWNKTRWPLPA